MLPKSKMTSTTLIAALAFGGLFVRYAESPSALLGLGTDFISGVMFGAAIALVIHALGRSAANPT